MNKGNRQKRVVISAEKGQGEKLNAQSRFLRRLSF
jgi:hypothetical protein